MSQNLRYTLFSSSNENYSLAIIHSEDQIKTISSFFSSSKHNYSPECG